MQSKTTFPFIENFLSDRNVGAFFRSSRFLVNAIAKRFPQKMDIAIEFGPGNGIMTRAILKKMPPHGKLIVVEQNEPFLKALAEINDPRLIVVRGLAQEFDYDAHLGSGEKADLIIASIPFSFLEKEERQLVCNEASRHLAQDGTFIIFHQFSTIMKEVMQQYFISVTSRLFLWNIFPCFIIKAKN